MLDKEKTEKFFMLDFHKLDNKTKLQAFKDAEIQINNSFNASSNRNFWTAPNRVDTLCFINFAYQALLKEHEKLIKLVDFGNNDKEVIAKLLKENTIFREIIQTSFIEATEKLKTLIDNET